MSEQQIFYWDFFDGTIDGFSARGTPPEVFFEDTRYACRLRTLGEAGSSILYVSFEGQSSVRVLAELVLEALPAELYGIASIMRISNLQLFGTPNHLFYLSVQNRAEGYVWRIEYYTSEGAMGLYVSSPLAQIGQDYQIEIVLQSSSHSLLNVKINGQDLFHEEGFNNADIVHMIDTCEFGLPWSAANCSLKLYSTNIYGLPTTYYSLSGTVVNVNGNPVQAAGIGLNGFGATTDSNGVFSFPQVPQGTYILTVLKAGYETAEQEIYVGQDLVLPPIIITESPAPTFWEISCFTVFPYWFSYSSTSFNELLSEIRAKFSNLVNTIDLRVAWKIDPANPNNMVIDDTVNDLAELDAAITKSHQNGFKIILGMVHAYTDPTSWGPTDFVEWWNNYRAFLNSICLFAQQRGVEYLIIGWEYNFLDNRFEDGGFDDEWNTTISEARSLYEGYLTYEFNWFYTQQQYQDKLNCSFFNNLDFIAISAYPNLSSTFTPTLADILNGWVDNPLFGFNYVEAFRQISNAFGKRILLNTGYASVDGCNTAPYTKPTQIPDAEEQALCWEGFFLAFRNESYLLGATMEHFDKPYIAGDTTSSFRGKLSETVIKEQLGQLAPPKPSIPSWLIAIPIVGLILSTWKKKG